MSSDATELLPPEGTEEGKAVFVKVGECLYRHQSSGTYYALVKKGGRQFRKSLKTKDRQLASRRLSEQRTRVSSMADMTGKGNITFNELADRWFETVKVGMKPASAVRRQVSLRNLSLHFRGEPVRNLTTRDCEAWMIGRSKKVSASSYNNERETLQAVLAFAKRDGLILDNPAESLARKKMEQSVLEIPNRDQFVALVAEMRKPVARAKTAADFVELLAYSGMRKAEASGLRWEDIDFERDRFAVTGGEVGTKNHEVRQVPLFPAMKELLARLRKELVEPVSGRVIPIDSAKKALATGCRKAGIPDFGHHSMRHFFVSNAIEKGIDFKTIAAWVGHKDGGILVAKTYGHLRDPHSAEMAKRMTF